MERLTFRGLSFQHTDANLAPDYPHSVQGAHTQSGALVATGMRDSRIEDCVFTRLGEHGVSLREYCHSNVVRHCRFHDLGGGGVYLSEGAPARRDDAYLTAHNTVDNKFIHDGGHIFRAACGVFLGGSASYNTITHNHSYPWGNIVSNNIFAFSQDAELIRNTEMNYETQHVALVRNIVYGPAAHLLGGSGWKKDGNFSADRNLYWSTATNAPDFAGRSFATWQAEGFDRNGRVADPLFLDADSREFPQGRLRGAFDLRHETGAVLSYEWRDWPAGQSYQSGPNLRVNADGALMAGGRRLLNVPAGQWVRVEVACGTGVQADATWRLAVTLPGQPPRRFEGLPCGAAFKRLNWVGFISLATAETVFYLDNVELVTEQR